jgi:acetyl-CoA carboxylase, biotin carboxylase subunit
MKKLLVANRGEIAIRVIRAARDLGIRTVAVYSEADRDSLHVKIADEAYCIGPKEAAASYLYIPNIVAVADISGADAVHPGYGFLSENATFADALAGHKIAFVGPSAEAIRLVGNKVKAREIALEAGVPITPGSPVLKDAKEALTWAREIGFPVILKAAGGGGGKGMRIIENAGEIAENFELALAESKAAFNSTEIYLEKYISRPRHVEIQIMGDGFGNRAYLFERDCSIQRRHQKLIEEAPSTVIDENTRRAMGEAACRIAAKVNYTSAGTVEFLYDASTKQFFFMEVNSRLQVEHPVTELVTGVDLVVEQLRVASGLPLSFSQGDLRLNGHAIECRICAEDSENDFAPDSGRIDFFLPPGGPWMRVDTHVYSGYDVPVWYDSLLAKFISWGRTRDEAIRRMRRALLEASFEPLKTTIPFHLSMLASEGFKEGNIHTGLYEEEKKKKAAVRTR